MLEWERERARRERAMVGYAKKRPRLFELQFATRKCLLYIYIYIYLCAWIQG